MRPRSMADYEACLAMDREPRVTQYIQGPWKDPQAHENFVRERIQRDWAPGLGYWSIFPRRAPAHFIGWVLLIPADGVGPDIEIGWRLRPEVWGQGYATEAARPVVAHAFSSVGLTRIVADIDARNIPSIRVAERLGMRFTGFAEGNRYPESVPYKSYVMTQDDFALQKEPPVDGVSS